MKPRYSVLQYIFGGYERPHEILEKDPDAEYILVTDDPEMINQTKTWDVHVDYSNPKIDPIVASWETRYNLFDFVHSDIVISMDADTIIKKSLKPFIDEFENGKYDVCVLPHPVRYTMDKEYAAWVKGRSYPMEQAVRCVQFMSSIGYDPCNHKGLYQGNFRISRNNKENSDYCRATIAFLKMLSSSEDGIERIDQNIASVVQNKWFTHWKVMPVSEQVVRSEALQWCYHNSSKPRMDAWDPTGTKFNFASYYDLTKPDMKYVYNKLQECFYFKDGKLMKVSDEI